MEKLTPAETEIMQVLWREAPLKPADILDRLGRPLSNPALRSTLRVLLEKEHVVREQKGKAYFYRPRKAAPVAFKSIVRRLADVFCDGTPYQLIAQLIKTEKLSPDDLRRLQQLAEQRVAESEAPPAKETNAKETPRKRGDA